MSLLFDAETNAYKRGHEDAQRAHRVKTFGAIRRAVSFARGLDASAAHLGATSMAAEVRRARAESLRHIIRTALREEA